VPHGQQGLDFAEKWAMKLFEDHARQRGVADRARFLPGGFFNDPLPSAQALIFGRVLHGIVTSTNSAHLSSCLSPDFGAGR
jgi:hypothetical protein